MFLSELREFPSAPCFAGKRSLITARVSKLLKSRTYLTCFRACFLPGRAKDLSALRCGKSFLKNTENQLWQVYFFTFGWSLRMVTWDESLKGYAANTSKVIKQVEIPKKDGFRYLCFTLMNYEQWTMQRQVYIVHFPWLEESLKWTV
jgi:hypothetical protein